MTYFSKYIKEGYRKVAFGPFTREEFVEAQIVVKPNRKPWPMWETEGLEYYLYLAEGDAMTWVTAKIDRFKVTSDYHMVLPGDLLLLKDEDSYTIF